MKEKNISREEAMEELLLIRQRCVEAIDDNENEKAYEILEDNGLDPEDLDDLI